MDSRIWFRSNKFHGMNDRAISTEGEEIAEIFLYVELFRAYCDGIYTTPAPETCRYEKSL